MMDYLCIFYDASRSKLRAKMRCFQLIQNDTPDNLNCFPHFTKGALGCGYSQGRLKLLCPWLLNFKSTPKSWVPLMFITRLVGYPQLELINSQKNYLRAFSGPILVERKASTESTTTFVACLRTGGMGIVASRTDIILMCQVNHQSHGRTRSMEGFDGELHYFNGPHAQKHLEKHKLSNVAYYPTPVIIREGLCSKSISRAQQANKPKLVQKRAP